MGQTHEIVAGGKHNAPLLGRIDAGASASVRRCAACPHLDEYQGAIGRAHDQVDFTAPASGGPIIALEQLHASALQMAQGGVLGGVTGLLARRSAHGRPSTWNFALTSSYASALAAASDAASSQHYPIAALYMVATPIGNLADISLRALHTLQIADTIACEDTRHTQTLLRAYGIDKAAARLLPLHQHNEREAAALVVERLRQGQRVAYASDAGTPGISDPGARLVAAVGAAGLRVIPIPGPSSVTAALSIAGIETDAAAHGSFVFAGFLPSRSAERAARIADLATEDRSVVLLEAPHRIEALAGALAVLGPRQLTVGRELSKQFEEIASVQAQGFTAWLQADANRCRGEFVLVLHPQPASKGAGDELRVLRLLLAELPLKSAVRIAAEISGASRNALYDAALDIKNGAA